MFANYRYNLKKDNRKVLRKIVVFPPLNNKYKQHKDLTYIISCLPKFDIEKFEPKESRRAHLIYKKLYKHGYQVDLQALSLFALSKKKRANKCIKRFISYCENTQNKTSSDGIHDYQSSGHLVGIGKQADGMMVLELFSKKINMHSSCVYSLINVVMTNIFQHLTYEAVKKGLVVVMDNLGYNIRLWQDRKLFYLFKVLRCTFHFAAIVNVDTSKQFSKLFIGFLESLKLADVAYMVRRSDTQRANIFRKAVWSEAVWGGKQLPMLRAKFPNLKLSKQFGGSNKHLLKLLTAKEIMLKSLLKFRKVDLTTEEESSLECSRLEAITALHKVKNDTKSIFEDHQNISNISRKIARLVFMVPSIELLSIPEVSSIEIEDYSSSSSTNNSY